MKIMAFDPFVPADKIQAEGVEVTASLEDLYAKSDFVSLHIPANNETKGSIGYALLSKMPKGGCLVNTARKEVINEPELVKVLEERQDLKYITEPDLRLLRYRQPQVPGKQIAYRRETIW